METPVISLISQFVSGMHSAALFKYFRENVDMIVLNIAAECLTNRRKYQEGKIKARGQRPRATE
jgi:hypothetical protein